MLEEHYVPRRSQRTRSVLTFFAQDGQTHDPLYANADLTKPSSRTRSSASAGSGSSTTGQKPGLLVFDSKLTTHAELAELDEQGIGFITLRRRGRKLINQLEALPASAWQPVAWTAPASTATDRHREDRSRSQARLPPARRQRPRPRPAHAAPHQPAQLTAKQLIERYGKRWVIENQLAEQIRAFHLDSLCSQVPLAVDFDVALTVLADIVYRQFARGLHTGYRTATPDTIRDFIDGIGELHFTPGHRGRATPPHPHPSPTRRRLPPRTTTIPWWDGRKLTFTSPPPDPQPEPGSKGCTGNPG